MSGVEINLAELGEDSIPGLRVAVGLDEMRDFLVQACEGAWDVLLHFAREDEMWGRVSEVGSGVMIMEPFGSDENARTMVPFDKIVWIEVKLRG